MNVVNIEAATVDARAWNESSPSPPLKSAPVPKPTVSDQVSYCGRSVIFNDLYMVRIDASLGTYCQPARHSGECVYMQSNPLILINRCLGKPVASLQAVY